jgi:hypothetical protein
LLLLEKHKHFNTIVLKLSRKLGSFFVSITLCFWSCFLLTVSSFFAQLLFSKIKKELLLVALFFSGKIGNSTSKGFPLSSGLFNQNQIIRYFSINDKSE